MIWGSELGPWTQRSAFNFIWETHFRMDESLKKGKTLNALLKFFIQNYLKINLDLRVQL